MRIKIVVLTKQCKAQIQIPQIQIPSPINLLPIGLSRVPKTQKTRECLMKWLVKKWDFLGSCYYLEKMKENKSKDFSKNMLSNLWTLRRSENKGACQSKKTGQETQKKESRE